MNGDAHKILNLKLNFEKNKYDEKMNDFQFGIKKKKINKMVSDFNRVMIRKENFPQSNYWGAVYQNYDPVNHWNFIQRGIDKINSFQNNS